MFNRCLTKQNIGYTYNAIVGMKLMCIIHVTLKTLAKSHKPDTNKYCIIPLIFGTRMGKFIETQSNGYQGLGEKGMRSYCLMNTEFQYGNAEKVLKIVVTII